jgi:hypothetical protein
MIEVLFDLDGTLADYDSQLKRDLEAIASPGEAPIEDVYYNPPAYISARRHVITSQEGWWIKLPKFELGWDILKMIRFNIPHNECRIQVLTKGPKTKSIAWKEKLEWCQEHLGGMIDGVTITHDKSLVYGRILVDDWPGYIQDWLKFRPRGLVIMPAHSHNADFKHPNVIRYDGSNSREVIDAIIKVIPKGSTY